MTYPDLRETNPMFTHARSLMAAVLSAMLVAGCSSDAPSESGTAAANQGAPDRVSGGDPEGAALPLSIGGRVEAGDNDMQEVAVNCAAALGITAERLASMSDNPQSAEIVLIGKAEDFFTAEASAAAALDDTAVGSVEAEIARRRVEKSSETTEQAQLAIACLRRYGGEVSGQGAVPL